MGGWKDWLMGSKMQVEDDGGGRDGERWKVRCRQKMVQRDGKGVGER